MRKADNLPPSCTIVMKSGNFNFLEQSGNLGPVMGLIYLFYIHIHGTAVAQWLRCCATNRKVAGSIPAGVIGFFIDIKSSRSHCGLEVGSFSNRNEYQE